MNFSSGYFARTPADLSLYKITENKVFQNYSNTFWATVCNYIILWSSIAATEGILDTSALYRFCLNGYKQSFLTASTSNDCLHLSPQH